MEHHSNLIPDVRAVQTVRALALVRTVEVMAKPPYRYAHERARAVLLADEPPCVHCGERVAAVADHQPPLSQHRHIEGSRCCTRVPSCRPCSDRQGGRLGRRRFATWRGNSVTW